jgi:hypothetical protein
VLALLLAAAIQLPNDTAVHKSSDPVVSGPVRRATSAPLDTVRKRHTVELSDAYYTRLAVHRWGSYAELPLFASEYWLGNKLLARGTPVADWVKPTHVGVALGLGGLFGLNTITGAWNLAEGWSQLGDRKTLVIAHTALMLASDAGFALAGATGGDARELDGQQRHRTIALTSIGLATVGTAIMWFTRNK